MRVKCMNCDSNDMDLHEFYWQCNSCLTKHQLDEPIVKKETVVREVSPMSFYSTSATVVYGMTTSAVTLPGW